MLKISKTEEIDIKIDEILEYDGPVICEVIVPADQKIIPTVSSRVNDDGSMSSQTFGGHVSIFRQIRVF